MLEIVEVALHEIALAADAPADGAMEAALADRGDVCLGVAPADELAEHRHRGRVGDDVEALEACEQVRGGIQIVGLAGGQHEPHR